MRKSIGRELLLLLTFFGSIWAVVSYFSEDEAEDWDVIPEDLYDKLGDFVIDDFSQSSSLILIANDSFSLESWNEILHRLDFDNSNCRAIYLSRNPEVNAYTLPGDNIVVYSGLIEFVESGEELAAVMAHEFGHVKKGHVRELLKERFAMTSLIMIVSGDAGGNLLLELSDFLFTAAFSRDNEKEADYYGLELLEKGNLSTRGMLRFFEKLEEEKMEMPEIISAFSSHPLSADRLEYIRTHAAKSVGDSLLNMNWNDFQKEMLDLAAHGDQ